MTTIVMRTTGHARTMRPAKVPTELDRRCRVQTRAPRLRSVATFTLNPPNSRRTRSTSPRQGHFAPTKECYSSQKCTPVARVRTFPPMARLLVSSQDEHNAHRGWGASFVLRDFGKSSGGEMRCSR
jgi:hypothetical protein